MEVAHGDRVALRFTTGFVTAAIDEAAFRAAARKDAGEDFRMVPAPAAVEGRLAAKFRGHHDHRAREQTAGVQVADKSGEGSVEFPAPLLHAALDVLVHVPAA